MNIHEIFKRRRPWDKNNRLDFGDDLDPSSGIFFILFNIAKVLHNTHGCRGINRRGKSSYYRHVLQYEKPLR